MVNLSDFFTTFKKWSYIKTELEEDMQDELDKLNYSEGIVSFNEREINSITIQSNEDRYGAGYIARITGECNGEGNILLFMNNEYHSQTTSNNDGEYNFDVKLPMDLGTYSFYTIFKQNNNYNTICSETINLTVTDVAMPSWML